jgi:hypothetical protein
MQFFGLLGLMSFLLGFCSLAGLLIEKAVAGVGLGERPLMILSVLLVILGVQFLSMGLLGELLTRIYHEVGQRPPYVIRRTAGIELGSGLASNPEAALAGQGPVSGGIEVDVDDDGLPARELPGRTRWTRADRLGHGPGQA